MTDILERLVDLHKQATEERSHFYVGKCVRDAMEEIARLRMELERIKGAPKKPYDQFCTHSNIGKHNFQPSARFMGYECPCGAQINHPIV